MAQTQAYEWTCYGVTCPTTYDVVYVGVTKNPKVRLKQHIKDARCGRKSVFWQWLRDILLSGYKPGFVVLEAGAGYDKASDAERRWIATHSNTGKLLNRNPGGVDHNLEAFKKQCAPTGRRPQNMRAIKSLTTGVIFESAAECARQLQVKYSRVYRALSENYRCVGHQLAYADSNMLPVARRQYKARARSKQLTGCEA